MVYKLIPLFLSPKGRIRRNQFWAAWILILLLGLGLNIVRDTIGQTFLTITYIYLVVTIYGKRLHDLGKSAWKLAGPIALHCLSFIALIFAIQSAGRSYQSMNDMFLVLTIIGLTPTLIWLVYAFMVGVPQGNKGDNRFGPDPRDHSVFANAPGNSVNAELKSNS